MSTLTALYYPHITIANKKLLKNALFLWDQVEYISPFGAAMYEHTQPSYQQALELITRPLKPTKRAQMLAHRVLVEIADSRLPEWFFPRLVNRKLRYNIYPQKFLPETWEALKRTRLVRQKAARQVRGRVIGAPGPILVSSRHMRKVRERVDRVSQRIHYETAAPFGLTMMSVLAECCAGQTRQLVTDEVDSYAALDRYLKTIAGAEPSKSRASDFDRLVTVSLETLNLSKVSIRRLVELRAKEDEQPQLRSMRHNYLAKLETYVERTRTEAKSRSDILEIRRVFRQEVRDDVAFLKEELKAEGKKVFFSKEFAFAVVATAGTVVEPITGALLGAGALYKKKVEYKVARNKTLDGHPMSWLYEMKRFKIY